MISAPRARADKLPFRRLFFDSGSNELLGDEPHLKFVRPENLADQKIVGAIVAVLFGGFGRFASFFDDQFVCLKQPIQLHVHIFPAARRTLDARRLGDIGGHGDRNSAQCLNSLGDRVHQFHLLVEMFVEEKMKLIKRRAENLPVMFLVHIAERHCVGQDLIQPFTVGLPDLIVQGDLPVYHRSELLDFSSGGSMAIVGSFGSFLLHNMLDPGMPKKLQKAS